MSIKSVNNVKSCAKRVEVWVTDDDKIHWSEQSACEHVKSQFVKQRLKPLLKDLVRNVVNRESVEECVAKLDVNAETRQFRKSYDSDGFYFRVVDDLIPALVNKVVTNNLDIIVEQFLNSNGSSRLRDIYMRLKDIYEPQESNNDSDCAECD